MKRRLGTRIAAMLMAVVMLITQLPLTAIAEDLQASRNESAQNQAQSDDSQDLTGTEKANSAYGAVNQITGMELTASGTTGDCTWTLYGSTTAKAAVPLPQRGR